MTTFTLLVGIVLFISPSSSQFFDLCQFIKRGECVANFATGQNRCGLGTVPVDQSNLFCRQSQHTCCERAVGAGPVDDITDTNPTVTEPPPTRECGRTQQATPTARVVNGGIVSSCNWPWMVSIRGADPTSQRTVPICTGALIDKNRVVTTAHCVQPFMSSQFTQQIVLQVVVGEHDVSFWEVDEQIIPVVRAVIHPNYDQTTMGNDLAVLLLSQDVQYSACRSPICLPTDTRAADSCTPAKEECTVASWGILYENAPEFPLPSQSNVTMFDNIICSYLTSNGDDLPENTKCVVPTKDDVKLCNGDDGGIVMSKSANGFWTLRGLVSKPVCEPKTPSLVTDIEALSDWLLGVQ